MDSYSEHPSEFDLPTASVSDAAQAEGASVADAADAVAAAIGTDERRMHVRAYNHWASLLDGRDFPSIEDLEPDNVADFSGHSILLDFTCGGDNPAIPFIGAAIREECGLADDARTIADVPSRSLLSRLTDHYLQIIANRAPIGFEAEFANQRDATICYRGILMPFSSDGETIDFIYGVINWKTVDAAASETAPAAAPIEAAPLALVAELAPVAAEPAFAAAPEQSAEHVVWEDGPLSEAEPLAAGAAPDADAGLADRLWAARETAAAAKAGEGRTRAALYQALSLAYDFAVAAHDHPADYAELLEESGVKSQARAPMTPVVKLVFGIDYDKARLTEFAAALSFAHRQDVGLGGLKALIEQQPGGLKALVAAERAARRPTGQAPDAGEVARNTLRNAAPLELADIKPAHEFSLVLTRLGADGQLAAVALIEDQALVARALRHAASSVAETGAGLSAS